MSVIVTKEICCDECGVRFPVPSDTTNGEMRGILRRSGWQCRRWIWRNGKRVKQIDQCTTCVVLNRLRARK